MTTTSSGRRFQKIERSGPVNRNPGNKLEDGFNNLTQSAIKYVVLDGWERLPHDYPTEINILVEPNPVLVGNMMGLTASGGKASPRYFLAENNLTVWLRQKGTGFLPNRFESELLARAITAFGCVKHIDMEHDFWYKLWKLVYFTDKVQDLDIRKALDRKLSEVIGMARLRSVHSKDMEFYPANHRFTANREGSDLPRQKSRPSVSAASAG